MKYVVRVKVLHVDWLVLELGLGYAAGALDQQEIL